MKSMNSATPASRDPGPSSLGMMISESRSTIGYSSAKKNCGMYVALLICWTPLAAACTGSQANAHLLNPANPAAAEAVAKIRNISRRSIPCPATPHLHQDYVGAARCAPVRKTHPLQVFDF